MSKARLIYDNKEKSEVLNQYFSSVCTREDQENMLKMADPIIAQAMQILEISQHDVQKNS